MAKTKFEARNVEDIRVHLLYAILRLIMLIDLYVWNIYPIFKQSEWDILLARLSNDNLNVL